MVRIVLAAAVALSASNALADAAAPAGPPDMSKMGPWSRKPTNEKQTKKEIEGFVKSNDDAEKKKDVPTLLAMLDFPVFMTTDDSKGVPGGMLVDKEQYTAMMKPFWENAPADSKATHKLQIAVLSDSLVTVVDDFAMTAGGHKMSGRNQSLIVKKDGQWKWKAMTEAGWGDMHMDAPAQPAAAPAAK